MTRQFEKILFLTQFDQLNNMVRWNGFNRITDETVGQHSHVVSWLTALLCEEIFDNDSPKLEAIRFAIFHDSNEYITGDVNHNVKYNEFNGTEIKRNLDEFINYFVDNQFPKNNPINRLLNSMLKEEIKPYIKKIVKLADWMSMYMYLAKEQSLGNKNAENKIRYCYESMLKTADEAITELEKQNDYKINLTILK